MEQLTPDDAFKLGDQFRDAATALGEWRIRNRASLSLSQWEKLDDQAITLLNMASSINTSAIGLILTDSQAALARLQSSVEEAKSAVKHIEKFKQALDLASALILLGGAVYSGNAAGMPAAIVALQDSVEAIVTSDEPGA